MNNLKNYLMKNEVITRMDEVKNCSPSCKPNYSSINLISTIYIISIIGFIVVGILNEIHVIERCEFEEDSIWWHGFIAAVCTPILVYIACNIQNYLGIHSKYFWHVSHIIAFMIMTLLSPGQWAFWIAAGILWEFFECYMYCWDVKKLGCNGYYDIIANIAGVAIGMWIKSNMALKSTDSDIASSNNK